VIPSLPAISLALLCGASDRITNIFSELFSELFSRGLSGKVIE
jgi:hypothetical protein